MIIAADYACVCDRCLDDVIESLIRNEGITFTNTQQELREQLRKNGSIIMARPKAAVVEEEAGSSRQGKYSLDADTEGWIEEQFEIAQKKYGKESFKIGMKPAAEVFNYSGDSVGYNFASRANTLLVKEKKTFKVGTREKGTKIAFERLTPAEIEKLNGTADAAPVEAPAPADDPEDPDNEGEASEDDEDDEDWDGDDEDDDDDEEDEE